MDAPRTFQRFHDDHARVLERLDALEQMLAASGDGPIDAGLEAAVLRSIDLLGRQFATHMRAEEEVLFPVLGRLSGVAAMVEPLVAEHADLRQMLADLARRIDRPAGAARDQQIRVELRDLIDLLRLHVHKEEATVFRVTEQVLDAEEFDAVAARLEATRNDFPLDSRRSLS